MIDLHCHILPGVDDGSPNLETSLAMARQAVSEGIDIVVATPHFRGTVDFAEQLRARDEALKTFRGALQQEEIGLTVLAGAECTSNGHLFTQEIPQHPAVLMPTAPGVPRTALVELPLNLSIEHAGDLLFQAQLADYRLILAHPERYPHFDDAQDLLKEMLGKGVFLQFNTQALRTGFFHRRQTRLVLDLMKFAPEQVLLATDAHDAKCRPVQLTPAREVIVRALGEPFWQQLVVENPRRILGQE